MHVVAMAGVSHVRGVPPNMAADFREPPFFKQGYLLTYFIPRENNDIANVSLSCSQKGSNLLLQNVCGRAPPVPAGDLALTRLPSRNKGAYF